MWYLVFITLLNALANTKQFIVAYRIQAGAFPINMLDMTILAGLLLLPLLTNRTAAQRHPALTWILTAYAAAAVGGMIMSVVNELPLRGAVNDLRDMLAVPVCVYLGYMYLANFRTAERFPAVQVIAGVGTAVLILVFFFTQGSQVVSAYDDDINRLRTVQYISQYAGIAAAVLLFAGLAEVRFFPPKVAILLAGLCFVGQFATLSRSDWIAELATILLVCFALPVPGQRAKKAFRAISSLLVLAAFVWGTIYLMSQVSGRDFHAKMVARIQTMLPGAEKAGELKAWDTRLPGIIEDARLWTQNPVLGKGLGIHAAVWGTLADSDAKSLGHNSWVTTLAQTGIVGFGAVALLIVCCVVIGWRMIRDRTDRASLLIGALGVITAVNLAVLGIGTGAFNNLRGGMLLGLTCGILLRCRAMQLEWLRGGGEGQDTEYAAATSELVPAYEYAVDTEF